MTLAATTPAVAFTRVGAGPPLVLLHPLGADREVWTPVLAALAAEHDVIAVDLPGFGESPPADLPAGWAPTPARLADAVAQTIDELGLDLPAVAGISLGGWVALELAVRGRVRNVTAIAPAGLWARPLGPKPGVARRLARGLDPVLPALLRTGLGRTLALSGTVGHPRRVPAAAALHLVRCYATAPGFAAVNAAMRAGTFTRLAEIRVPVTLGWPAGDRLVSRPKRLPADVTSVTLEDAGHVPVWDDPEAVTRLLLAGAAR